MLRSLLAAGGTALLSCGERRRFARRGTLVPEVLGGSDLSEGRLALQARPGTPAEPGPGPGLHPLGFGEARDGLLFVPSGYRSERPVPLVVMLHGAGGDAAGALAPFADRADAAGLVLVAPESRGRSWDVLEDDFGPDVAFVGRAVDHVSRGLALDPQRVAIEGFSDGASYALGLGLANGDLFGRVVAFSPGFVPAGAHVGRPSIFVSHGVHDPVLPIDRCSRRIVPELRRRGYDVRYDEFPEGHTAPPAIADEALRWLAEG